MIICPKCKEEIEGDSLYCDQCGQVLSYCDRCGRVGLGRRCTQCGGLMVPAEEYMRRQISASSPTSLSMGLSQNMSIERTAPSNGSLPSAGHHVPVGIPVLTLYNTSLGINIQGINGAVIGRRQGPYTQSFASHMYVSGVHAQLKYNAENGWCIVDKHSSNGTQLNQHPLQPDAEMSLRNGDIVTIANINLQVSVN